MGHSTNKQFEKRSLATGLVIGLSAWIVIMAVGCSKSSNGIQPVDPNAPIVNPYTCADPTCGMSYGTNYIALSPQAQQYLIQYYNSYAGYDTSATFRANRLSYSNILPLLRDAMGVCNREYYNGGMADCSYWNNAAHVMILSANNGQIGTGGGTAVSVTMWSAFMNDSSVSYSYQFPQMKYMLFGMLGVPIPTNPSAYYNPMSLQASIWPVNNNQGFEVRANGPSGTPSQTQLFQLQIATGKIGDAGLDFKMFQNGQALSTGRFALCQSPGCQYGY